MSKGHHAEPVDPLNDRLDAAYADGLAEGQRQWHSDRAECVRVLEMAVDCRPSENYGELYDAAFALLRRLTANPKGGGG